MSEENQHPPEEKTELERLALEVEKGQESVASADPSQELDSDSTIPEKFIGKTAEEVISTYSNLEKDHGRISSELGEERKRREELQIRMDELRTQYNSQPIAPQQPMAQAPIEQDLDKLFNEEFDEDPKQAILNRQIRHEKKLATDVLLREQALAAKELNSYYHQQVSDNPDFKRREPLMRQLAEKFSGILDQTKINSKETLEFLNLASQGVDIKHYEELAIKTSKQSVKSVLDEKRAAGSVSSSTEGNDTRAFESLSLEEMEKEIGTV